jgi:hypothetical protein
VIAPERVKKWLDDQPVKQVYPARAPAHLLVESAINQVVSKRMVKKQNPEAIVFTLR